MQSSSHVAAPTSHAKSIAKRIRAKELIPMCIIRLDNANPSMLELARRAKRALDADLSHELEVVFMGLSPECAAHLTEWRETYGVHTLGDWTRTLRTIFAHGSDHCPNCGLMTFADSDTVPIYCSACGANPGTVFENAGGVFLARST